MEFLKSLRVRHGMSQQSVADYLGISRQAYSNYENGNRAPDNKTLLKLAEYFDTTVDYLLRGDVSKAGNHDKNDVGEGAENLLDNLEKADGLMFYGDPLTPEALEMLKGAVAAGLEAAKAKNKEKFTPKKYRKE